MAKFKVGQLVFSETLQQYGVVVSPGRSVTQIRVLGGFAAISNSDLVVNINEEEQS